MAKRDEVYTQMEYEPNGYPTHREGGLAFIVKNCDICRRAMTVNNWPDGKSRTPKFLGFIVCVDCDPRHSEDHYLKNDQGRIIHRGRLRVIRMAQVTRALARYGCLGRDAEWEKPGCKCAGCTAFKLMTPVKGDQ
jgi:hypothetical protein